MKYTTIIGILLFAIGIGLFSFADLQFDRLFINKEFIVGIFLGSGLGFFLGGIVGWAYKHKKIKREEAIQKAAEAIVISEQKPEENN